MQTQGNPHPNSTAKIYQRLHNKPLGKLLFSTLVSCKAPYFLTVFPRVQELRPGYAQVRAGKWWLVNNHIGTFHAIAMCNVAEFAMGCLAEASVPGTHRWLPMRMRTNYTAKSQGGLTLTATADLPDFSTITTSGGGQAITVKITAVDQAGNHPFDAEIDIWVTAKK